MEVGLREAPREGGGAQEMETAGLGPGWCRSPGTTASENERRDRNASTFASINPPLPELVMIFTGRQ